MNGPSEKQKQLMNSASIFAGVMGGIVTAFNFAVKLNRAVLTGALISLCLSDTVGLLVDIQNTK